MKKNPALFQLRQKAERAIAENQKACTASFTDIENYLQELQIYHVELEMQAEELRAAQASLLQSRDRYLELFNDAPVGYISLSFSGMVLRANNTISSMLQTTPAALQKTPLANFIDKKDRALFFSFCQKARQSEKLRSCELLFVTKSGTSFPGHVDFLPVNEDTELGPHYRVCVNDISERKAAEQERLQLEREILNSQKEGSLHRLAGGIAHNCNNLLTVILGNIELVRAQLTDAPHLSEQLTAAYDNSLKLANLSNMMLHYLGQNLGKREQIELVSSTSILLDLFRRTVHGRLQIDFEPEEQSLEISIDPAHYAQMINNLLINSVEAIDQQLGHIRIRLGYRRVTSSHPPHPFHNETVIPGEYAWLEIEDNGCGIPANLLEKVTEPFFSTKFTGRGLGLSALWGTIHSYQGFFLLESEPGKGTRAQIYFPCLAPKTAADRPVVVPQKELDLFGKTILCIDDDAVIRMIIKRFLDPLGCRTVEAKNGEEAITLFRESEDPFSIVLLDFALPDFDGNLVLEDIRRHAPEIPVLAISGYHQDYLEDRFTREKPDMYLQKPFLRDELIEAIWTVINGKQADPS